MMIGTDYSDPHGPPTPGQMRYWNFLEIRHPETTAGVLDGREASDITKTQMTEAIQEVKNRVLKKNA